MSAEHSASRRVDVLAAEAPELIAAPFLDRMLACEHASHGDAETAHADADAILVELLRSLGYKELCDAYERVWKWYA